MLITSSTVQNKYFVYEEIGMEKVYLTMKHAGVFNIVFGILLAIGSVATAVGSAFLIMYGTKLLKKKSEIMF